MRDDIGPLIVPVAANVVSSQPLIRSQADLHAIIGGQNLLASPMLNIPQAIAPITEEAFEAAVLQWNRETSFVSSVSEITDHPAFRRIVAWGCPSVPFILRDLKTRPSLLIMALGEITGEDPVPPSAVGKVTEMSKSWLAWGEKNGLL